MLYRREAFEPLTETPWDEAVVRNAIRRMVADVDAAYDPDALWPADEWDGWQAAMPMKNLYVGAAGVINALAVLRRRGVADTTIDLAAAVRRTLDAFRAAPDFMQGLELPPQPEASLLCGEAGILLVSWGITGEAGLAGALLEHVHRNRDNAADDVMWGSPGTLVAARAMLAATGEERWLRAWNESANRLLSRREADGLWTQRLYGGSYRGFGPAHGVVGNVAALLPGLDEERRTRLERETAALLEREAVLADGCANWPMRAGGPLQTDDRETRLQWCAGAPGIVASAASYLYEELLLAGARLVWQAGPPGMEKGAGICHGTAGNGYAFLKAFARTHDEEWLARARRFAVHALEQVERRGRGRYSLWTGDLGVALYAADCLEPRTAYPILETFE